MQATTLLIAMLVATGSCFDSSYYVVSPGGAPCPASYTCQELSAYTNQSSEFFTSNTVFYFLSGHHILNQQDLVVINNVSNLTLQGLGTVEQGAHETVMQSTVVIQCTGSTGGFVFFNSSSVTVESITLTGCAGNIGQDGFEGYGTVALALVHLYNSHLRHISVQNASGYGLVSINCFNLSIEDSSFYHNQYTIEDCSLLGYVFCPGGNAFISYTDLYLTATSLPLTGSHCVEIIRSNFSFGLSVQYGIGSGLKIEANNADFSYRINILIDGVVTYANIGILGANLNVGFYGKEAYYTIVINNTASLFANAMPYIDFSQAFPDIGPIAITGAGFEFIDSSTYTTEANLFVYNSQFSHNRATSGSGVTIGWLSSGGGQVMLDTCLFHNNTGDTTSALFIFITADFSLNFTSPLMYLNKITVHANHPSNSEHNASLQSAITIQNVPITVINSIVVSNSLTTGLTAFSSILIFNGELNMFVNNSGVDGGGMALYGSSYIVLNKPTVVNLVANHASRNGGGMFVSQPATPSNAQCFFQTADNAPLGGGPGPAKVMMSKNTANVAGSALYGGNQIDGCYTLSSFDTVFEIVDQPGQTVVSSDPLNVCLCSTELDEVDCSTADYLTFAVPGRLFSIPVAAVGNLDGLTPAVISVNITSRSTLTFATTTAQCKSLSYSLRTTNARQTQVQVYLSLESSLTSPQSQIINASITVLPCPVGFELSTSSGICECSVQLRSMLSNVTCDVFTNEISKQGEGWVGYSNESNCTLVSSICPSDYCKKELVSFNITSPDSQCSRNRSGVLCGSCAEGLSLMLGTNSCGECSNVYLALLPLFALAGIVLVAILIALNMTVSIGAVNGLIFYANVVKTAEYFFFPDGPIPIVSQFISWINLDLGIETCFFDGLNSCTKTWLQFLFPAYIWVIIILVIIFVHFSKRLSRLVGTHVVPVLATLLLLSYLKLIRNVILALFIFRVPCQNEGLQAVWGTDGNISYFSGCHLPIVLAALVVLFFFIVPYTVFLLIGPIIEVYLTGYKCFRWIVKLKPILDAYAGPYEDKFRIWTGFLVVVRLLLALIISLSDNSNIGTDAMISIVVILLAIHCIAHRVYRKWQLNVLEITFLLNLVLLGYFANRSLLKFGRESYFTASPRIATIVLLSIAFLKFIGIVIYHILLVFSIDLESLYKKFRNKVSSRKKFKIPDNAVIFESASKEEPYERHRETLLLDNNYMEFIDESNG